MVIFVLLAIHRDTLIYITCNRVNLEPLTANLQVNQLFFLKIRNNNFCFLWLYSAHDCSIRGVAVDALNRITISASENGDLTFWQFKNKHFSTKNLNVTNYFNKIKLDEPINQILLHRERFLLF